MKRVKILFMVLFFALSIMNISGCIFSSDDDDDGGYTDGTLMVSISSIPDSSTEDVYFCVVTNGGDPGNQADWLGSGSFQLIAGGGSAPATNDLGDSTVFTGGGEYEVYMFIDKDGSSPLSPNVGDWTGDWAITIDGNSTINKTGADFDIKGEQGSVVVKLSNAATYNTKEGFFVVVTNGGDPLADSELLGTGAFTIANGIGKEVAWEADGSGGDTGYLLNLNENDEYEVYMFVDLDDNDALGAGDKTESSQTLMIMNTDSDGQTYVIDGSALIDWTSGP